jgi:DNA ligase (NAD+)
MSMMDDISRIDELETLLTKARNAYYNENKPIMPDDEYDRLRDELSGLQENNRAVRSIGAPVPDNSPWVKTRHHVLMGSLDKVTSMEQLTTWVRSVTPVDKDGSYQYGELFVTEKLDGISIHVVYENGRLKQAVTRGDGVIGEDIARNVALMKGVPDLLSVDGHRFTGSLRGEIIITRSDFEMFFRDDDYKNTRNAAGGVAKRLDGSGCEHLTVMFYQVVEGRDFETEAEQFEWLNSAGLLIPNWYVTAMVPGVRTPHDIWCEYQQVKRDQLDYDIDGLVVRINNLARQISLGDKDGHPVGARAFKFAAIDRETVSTDVEEQTGSTGRITPVAVFKPVNLLGTTVTNASLYNWRYIAEIGFDIGATIKVARANDVIPRVISVVKGTGKTYPTPTKCRSCGATPVQEGEYWVCPNTAECPAQTSRRIRRYVQTLNVLEVGETLIDKLVAAELVRSFVDLYRLTVDSIAQIERMGPKSAQKVIDSLWSVNPVPMETLLGAMSIPGCAESTIRMVMDAGYDTFDKLRNATVAELQAVPGLGPVKASSLAGWLSAKAGLVDELDALGVKIRERQKGGLTGKSFCFTGSMPSGRKRDVLGKLVEDQGGTVKDNVSKGLTYLVVANPNSNSSKIQAARKNGTKCISEDEFNAMVGCT